MGSCDVIISNSSQSFGSKLDYLSYKIPDYLKDEIQIGSLVMVPLGKSKENALVININSDNPSEAGGFRVKDIEEVLSHRSIFPDELIALIKKTADHYCCSYEDVLNAALPSSLIPKPERVVELKSSHKQSKLIEIEGSNEPKTKSEIILEALGKARGRKARLSRLRTLTGLSTLELRKELLGLQEQGVVDVKFQAKAKKSRVDRDPLERLRELENEGLPELTKEQAFTLNQIDKVLSDKKKNGNKQSGALRTPKFVLHGITGSGKTEIYLRMIEKTFSEGKTAIVLVPEISMTPQMAERLSERFGKENVLIWHSALSTSEREHSWQSLTSDETKNKPKVIVGPRSALWAPIRNLGLIVVDEEHENSYKQESPNPRYHACKVAQWRAELNDCPIIYGSATPSTELYYKANSDELSDYHLLELKKRVFDTKLPSVSIVDMREEFLEGNKSIFSKLLKKKIEEALENEKQVILFLNKRGSASHVFCRNCGYIYECRNCETKMVYHEASKLLICHHCGLKEQHPEACPECASPAIKFFGLGTQSLETETRKAFPEAKIARLDSDTGRIKHSYIDILENFRSGKTDILIGTQMVAKGLDIETLSTVGIISADNNFAQIDFQSEERGFQLLTQVAGRAGRRDDEGSVVLQSYQPERYTILAAKEQDYKNFYSREISERQDLLYPPFSTIIKILSTSPIEEVALEDIERFKKALEEAVTKYQPEDKTLSNGTSFQDNLQILGPSPATIPKVNKKFRYHMLLKVIDHNPEVLNLVKSEFKVFKPSAKTTFLIDVDSISLY